MTLQLEVEIRAREGWAALFILVFRCSVVELMLGKNDESMSGRSTRDERKVEISIYSYTGRGHEGLRVGEIGIVIPRNALVSRRRARGAVLLAGNMRTNQSETRRAFPRACLRDPRRKMGGHCSTSVRYTLCSKEKGKGR